MVVEQRQSSSLTPRVLVLGPVAVVDEARGPIEVTGHAGRLLVELVGRGPTVTRDRLLDVLWPHDAPKSADAALRVHLSRLRKLLQGAGVSLVHRDGGYAAVGATTDLDLFDDLMGRARVDRQLADDPDGLATAHALVDQALGLWRGEPLGRFGERDDVADLVQGMRNRREAAEDLAADLLLERGLHQVAVVVLEGAAASRPFHEQCWARLMVALYRCGRQRDALAAFERARLLLVEALGVEPGPELRRLEHDILHQRPSLDWAPPGPPTPGRATAPPAPASARRSSGAGAVPGPTPATTLVGRAAERDRLRTAAGRRARAGLQIAIVRGEAGIGKTALVESFAREQRDRGDTTAIGRCDRNAAIPLHAFLTAMDPFIGAEGGPTGIEVAQLLGAPGADRIRSADEVELQRHRVLTRLGDLVAERAEVAPMVLVVDDAQWADPMSLSFVEHLATNHVDAPVLLVLVVRAGAESTSLDSLVADLKRAREIDRIELGALTVAEIAALVGSRLAADPVLGIHRASGGNPLYALQLGRLMGEEPHGPDLPEDLHEICRARLRGLSQDALDLLEIGAVLGLEIDASEVAAMADVSRLALSPALTEVQRAGLMEPTDRLDSFRFVHGIIHRVVYEQIDGAHRAHLHVAAAAVIARDAAGREGDIAVHLAEARPLVTDEVIGEAAVRAGNAAMRLGAHRDAGRFFQIVLSLAAPSPGQRQSARFGLGLELALGGDRAASEGMLAESMKEARNLGRWDLVADTLIARTRFGLPPTIPVARREVGLIDEVLTHMADAETTRRAYLLCWKAELLMNSMASEANEAILQAEQFAASVSDDVLRGLIALARLRQAESACEDPRETQQVATELVQRAADAGDDRLVRRAALHLQAARLRSGDYREMRQSQPELMADLRRPPSSAIGLNWRLTGVGLALATEPLSDANATSRSATEDVPAELAGTAMTSRMLNLMQIRYEQLRINELEPVLLTALESSPRRIMRPFVAAGRVELGDVAGTHEQLELFAAELEDMAVDWAYLATLALAAEVAAAANHTALADALEERMSGFAPQVVVACSVLMVLGHIDRYLGLLAALRGDLDLAVVRLASARRHDEGSGSPLWMAWAAHDEASVRLRRGARGDLAAARDLLVEAAPIARTFGSARLERAVEGTTSLFP